MREIYAVRQAERRLLWVGRSRWRGRAVAALWIVVYNLPVVTLALVGALLGSLATTAPSVDYGMIAATGSLVAFACSIWNRTAMLEAGHASAVFVVLAYWYADPSAATWPAVEPLVDIAAVALTGTVALIAWRGRNAAIVRQARRGRRC